MPLIFGAGHPVPPEAPAELARGHRLTTRVGRGQYLKWTSVQLGLVCLGRFRPKLRHGAVKETASRAGGPSTHRWPTDVTSTGSPHSSEAFRAVALVTVASDPCTTARPSGPRPDYRRATNRRVPTPAVTVTETSPPRRPEPRRRWSRLASTLGRARLLVPSGPPRYLDHTNRE